MGILDIKRAERQAKQEAEKLKQEMLICQWCGRRMEDNSFQKRSRMAGSYDCTHCGFKIIF